MKPSKKKILSLKELTKEGLAKQRKKLKVYRDNVAEYTAKFQRAKDRMAEAKKRLLEVIDGHNPRWFFPTRNRRRRRPIHKPILAFNRSVAESLTSEKVNDTADGV